MAKRKGSKNETPVATEAAAPEAPVAVAEPAATAVAEVTEAPARPEPTPAVAEPAAEAQPEAPKDSVGAFGSRVGSGCDSLNRAVLRCAARRHGKVTGTGVRAELAMMRKSDPATAPNDRVTNHLGWLAEEKRGWLTKVGVGEYRLTPKAEACPRPETLVLPAAGEGLPADQQPKPEEPKAEAPAAQPEVKAEEKQTPAAA